MFTSANNRTKAFRFLVFFMLASLCMLSGEAQERSLLQRATQVTRLSGYEAGWRVRLPGFSDWHSYYWLSDQELMIVTTRKHREFLPVLFNMATNRLTARNTDIVKLYPNGSRGTSMPELSPDRKWMLWCSYGPGLSARVNTCRIDGSQHKETSVFFSGYWMQDSRHWIAIDYHFENGAKFVSASVHDLMNPVSVTKFPIDADSPINKEEFRLDFARSLFLSADCVFVMKYLHSKPANVQDIYELNLEEGGALVNKYTVTFPLLPRYTKPYFLLKVT
jgi:hypothetical protein